MTGKFWLAHPVNELLLLVGRILVGAIGLDMVVLMGSFAGVC